MELTRQNHELPEDVVATFAQIHPRLRNQYITALRDAGWTLESIGAATGLTRERVRQIAKTTVWVPVSFNIPTPPAKPEKVYKYKRAMNPDTEARLKELFPLANKVRFKSEKYREEAEEFTRLLHHANTVEGITLGRIAKALGVTRPALKFRLIRYGYEPAPNDTNTLYAPLKHRIIHTPTEE